MIEVKGPVHQDAPRFALSVNIRSPGWTRTNDVSLFRGNKVVAVLRTTSNVKPVFVSPGHKIDVAGSVENIMNCIFNQKTALPTAD